MLNFKYYYYFEQTSKKIPHGFTNIKFTGALTTLSMDGCRALANHDMPRGRVVELGYYS